MSNRANKTEPTYSDLAGKRVLITGAGAGLGRSMALAFARQECLLILNDLDQNSVNTVRKEVEETGTSAISLAGSVTSESDMDELFLRAVEEFGGVDILINNAGISTHEPTADITLEKWNKCIDVNLTAPLRCSQRAAAQMLQRGYGVILNMSSIYGLVAGPERVAYCATKAAIAMITKVMAIEWAEKGVRVNALAPTYVRTPLVEGLIEDGKINLAELEARTPNGRLALPEEISNLALFLASDAASSITGQVVAADGGWTSYGYV